MKHAKSGNHSVLHSEKRHRSRRYKRKIRILFIQIVFIIILIFVAIKFVKNDEEKPKVTSLSAETQKEIINNELQQENQNKEEENVKELKIPDISTQGVSILLAKLEYIQKENKTIVSIDVKNYAEKIQDMVLKIAFLNENDELLEETYLRIEYLDENDTTRVNIVIDKDITEAYRIELREEN